MASQVFRMDATSFMVRPSAINCSTSRCRGVRGVPPAGCPCASNRIVIRSLASSEVTYPLPSATSAMAPISSSAGDTFRTYPDAPARKQPEPNIEPVASFDGLGEGLTGHEFPGAGNAADADGGRGGELMAGHEIGR